MRHYEEFKPNFKEEYAYKFGLLHSVKNNWLAWIGFIISVIVIMSLAFYMPTYKFNTAKVAFNVLIADNKKLETEIDGKINTVKSLLMAFDYKDNQANVILNPLIQAKETLNSVEFDALMKHYDEVKQKSDDDIVVYPDSFSIAENAVNFLTKNQRTVNQYLARENTNIDAIIEFLKKAKVILDEAENQNDKNQVLWHVRKNLKPLMMGQFGEKADFENVDFMNTVFYKQGLKLEIPEKQLKKQKAQQEKNNSAFNQIINNMPEEQLIQLLEAQ